MKYVHVYCLLFVGALSLFTTAHAISAEPTKIARFEPKQCKKLLAKIGVKKRVIYPVQVLKMTYEMTNHLGDMQISSGLIVHPIGDIKGKILYAHGTQTHREKVPSRLGGLKEKLFACYFGSAGFVFMAPDYQGMGDSPGFHPYLHANSQAQAGVDLLYATESWMRNRRFQIPKLLFVTGYSQGGHAALAMHRLLEQQGREVTASAPMAGPYDLSGISTQASVLRPKPYESNLYMAFVVTAYQRVYGDIYADPSEVWLPDYEQVPDLFNGELSNEQVIKHLPATPEQLFQKSFIESVLKGEHRLSARMQENDLYSWSPKAPTLFVYGGGDKAVAPENAKIAYETMKQMHAEVSLMNVGDEYNHGSGFIPSLRAVDRFFFSKLPTVNCHHQFIFPLLQRNFCRSWSASQ